MRNAPHGTSPGTRSLLPLPRNSYGEATLTRPGNFISVTYAQTYRRNRAWNYRCNILQDDNIAAGLGVPHTFELPAILGLRNAGDSTKSSYKTYNAAIISVVMNCWIRFVRDLTPNQYKYASAPHWESFGNGRRIVLQTKDTKMERILGSRMRSVSSGSDWR